MRLWEICVLDLILPRQRRRGPDRGDAPCCYYYYYYYRYYYHYYRYYYYYYYYY